MRDTYRTVRLWIARINAFLQEHITGMSTVQLFRREERTRSRFDEINRAHRDANVDSIFYYAVFYPAIEVIGALASALIIWFGGLWTLQGALTLGSLVAFLQYSQRFFRPISDMSEKFNVLQAAMAVVGADLQAARYAARGSTSRARRLGDSARSPTQRGHIVFDNVSFAYNGTDFVLRDVSFEVRARRARRDRRRDRRGEVHAHQPAAALLRRDERPHPDRRRRRPRRWTSGSCAGSSAWCSRTSTSSREPSPSNIRLGNEAISDEAVREAARGRPRAPVHRGRCPDGYAHRLGERGATLSVGQKQLLSFARALAFDPRILILDEATSSVDTETELLIREALHVLMAGRTTLAIAHRLSTIQDMDKILVLHKGRAARDGHAPGAARPARHLLPALSAPVQGAGDGKLAEGA